MMSDITKILDIFQPDTINDTESQYILKECITKLPEPDRRIINLYAEFQSIRKVAKLLNTSYYYLRLKLKEIRNDLSEIIRNSGYHNYHH